MVGEVEITKRAQILMFQPLDVYIVVFLTIHMYIIYITFIISYTVHKVCNKHLR